MVEAWLNEIDAARTRTEYAADVALFRAWLGDTPLTAVDRVTAGRYAAHVRDLIGRSGRPLSDSTRARRLTVVSAFYRYLVQTGAVESNPMYEVPRPKVAKVGRTPAREARDLAAIYSATGGRDALVVRILSTSGLRVSELCRADVRDFGHEGDDRVVSCRTKGGGHRVVVLPEGVLPDLDAYLDGRTSGPLLLADDGGRLKPHHVTTILRRAARSAGVRDAELVRPHVLRASAITNWLEAGVPVQDVQGMVGHASPDTTLRYWRRRAGIKRDKALAEQMDAAVVARLSEGMTWQGETA